MPRPESLSLLKYHGAGNDFLIALEPPAGSVGPDLAVRACARHTGIGADGLIVGERPRAGGLAMLSFHMYNADGSEPELSGNGLRCLAHAALDSGWIEPGVEILVDGPTGPRRVSIESRGDGEAWGSVDMPKATVGGTPELCNVGDGRMTVEIGNPHLVVLRPDPADIDLASIGPRLEVDDQKGRRNVELVSLGPGGDELTMRVWERGVGETMACGTGSCAAAVACHHWGKVGEAVTVHQPGGSVEVRLGDEGAITLSGPSVRVAACLLG